jgi:uncharacterized membrane protein YkgB
MFLRMYRKVINIGIIVLLIWFGFYKYEEYQTSPKAIKPVYVDDGVGSQYSITIDPAKDPKDYSWTEKVVYYFYKDEVEQYRNKYNMTVRHQMANFGDMVSIIYEYHGNAAEKEQVKQRLTYQLGAQTSIPKEAADKVLGMRIGQSKEIKLKDDRVIKITLEKVKAGKHQ